MSREIIKLQGDRFIDECIVFCNTGDKIIQDNIFNDKQTAELFIVLFHNNSKAILRYFKTFNGTIMYYHLLEYIEDMRGD